MKKKRNNHKRILTKS